MPVQSLTLRLCFLQDGGENQTTAPQPTSDLVYVNEMKNIPDVLVKVKRRLVPIHSVHRQTRKQQQSDGESSHQTGSELSDKFSTHKHNTTCLTPLLRGWLQRANHCGPVQVVSVCHWDGEVEVEEQSKRRIFTQPAASTSCCGDV